MNIIIEEGNEENLAHYRVNATVKRLESFNQISFTRKAADAVNIYRRKSSGDSWEFIALAVNSPFDDHDAEVDWEYKVHGVKSGVEVGTPAVLSKVAERPS